jgi:hypothetical protein
MSARLLSQAAFPCADLVHDAEVNILRVYALPASPRRLIRKCVYAAFRRSPIEREILRPPRLYGR